MAKKRPKKEKGSVSRDIPGVGVVKHLAFDEIERKTKITIFCKFVDSNRKTLVSDNLNFLVDKEKLKALHEKLGIDKFNELTPLRVNLSVDEERIDDWEEIAHPPESKSKQSNLD